MENLNINRSSISTQPESVDAIKNKKPAINDDPTDSVLPVYPEMPEAEDSFRGYKIAPVEDGEETAPLEEDVINDPWNETNRLGIDNINMPGDQVDEYYEKLGQPSKEVHNVLDKDNYDTIPKPVK